MYNISFCYKPRFRYKKCTSWTTRWEKSHSCFTTNL